MKFKKIVFFFLIINKFLFAGSYSLCYKYTDSVYKSLKFNDSVGISFVTYKNKLVAIKNYTLKNDSSLLLGYQYFFDSERLRIISLVDSSKYFVRFNIFINKNNVISKIDCWNTDTNLIYFKKNYLDWVKENTDCDPETLAPNESGLSLPTSSNASVFFIIYDCHGRIIQMQEFKSINNTSIKNGIGLYQRNFLCKGTIIYVNGKHSGPSLILNKRGKLKYFIYYSPNQIEVTKLSLKQLKNRSNLGFEITKLK